MRDAWIGVECGVWHASRGIRASLGGLHASLDGSLRDRVQVVLWSGCGLVSVAPRHDQALGSGILRVDYWLNAGIVGTRERDSPSSIPTRSHTFPHIPLVWPLGRLHVLPAGLMALSAGDCSHCATDELVTSCARDAHLIAAAADCAVRFGALRR